MHSTPLLAPDTVLVMQSACLACQFGVGETGEGSTFFMHDVVSDENEYHTIETMRDMTQNSRAAEMDYMGQQLDSVDILPAIFVSSVKCLQLHHAHYTVPLCSESGTTSSSRLNVIGVSTHALFGC